MKNLKKILLATLVLVMVISAAVITVVASTEPTPAEKLAEIKDVPLETIHRVTLENGKRLYRI